LKRKRNGFAMIMVLVVMFVVIILGFTLVMTAIGNSGSMFHNKQSVQAFYAAQSGVARTVSGIYQGDPGTIGCNKTTTYLTNQSIKNGSRFSVVLTTNWNLVGCVGYATAPNGTAVPPGTLYVMSTGRMGFGTRLVNVLLTVKDPAGFGWGAFSNNGMSVQNGFVTGYDPGPIGNAGTDSGTISMGPNGDISGQIFLGPGATTNGVGKGGPNQTMTYSIPLPQVIDPLSGPLLFNAPPVLACGTTYSVQNLVGPVTMPDCGKNAPAVVYVYTSLDTSSGDINMTLYNGVPKATNLFVYGMPTLITIDSHANSSGAFALYAPQANVTINGNNSHIWGSVIANTIHFTGVPAGIYYDQGLATDPYASGVVVRSWSSQ
jgi:hypothetical protein